MSGGESKHGISWRLGVVSYLNAKPLIAGLDRDADIELIFEVPALLPGLLEKNEVDVALVPVIDLFRRDPQWEALSDAGIGCDGETMTVRVFARARAESIRRLHVDGESHTSVALATLLWRELYGIQLEIVPFAGGDIDNDCEAILLIGDKVVTRKSLGYEIEIDLGAAWKSMTSLPFVFAVWAAPRGGDLASLAERLARARDLGVAAAAEIAAEFGPPMGWPVALATRYLTTRLNFTLGPRHRAGMARFLELARKYDLVPPASELLCTQ